MIHFTADTHFNYAPILDIGHRNFRDIYHHDAYLISKINYYVGLHDTLIIVGDFCNNADPNTYLSKINCENIVLCFGNHDDQSKHYAADVTETKIVELRRGLKVVANHFPHAYWEGSHVGWGHVYGHTHAHREETLDKIWPERRSLDVGVDNAYRLFKDYRPFNEDEVFDYLTNKLGHDFISFYKELDAKYISSFA